MEILVEEIRKQDGERADPKGHRLSVLERLVASFSAHFDEISS